MLSKLQLQPQQSGNLKSYIKSIRNAFFVKTGSSFGRLIIPVLVLILLLFGFSEPNFGSTPNFSVTFFFLTWPVHIEIFLDSNGWAGQFKCIINSKMNYEQTIHVKRILCSLVSTHLALIGFFDRLLKLRKESKEKIMSYLIQHKLVRWFFSLDPKTQRWLKLVAIALLFALCFAFFSSTIPAILFARAVRFLGVNSSCAEQEKSEKAAPSSKKEKGASTSSKAGGASSKGQSSTNAKAGGSSSKGQPSTNAKAGGSSSKGQPSTDAKVGGSSSKGESSKEAQPSSKGKGSTSSKKNKSSTKASASESKKESKQPTKASKNKQLEAALFRNDESPQAMADQLSKMKAYDERTSFKGVPFVDLEEQKGGRRNELTKKERGETYQDTHLDYNSLPGDSVGERMGSILSVLHKKES